MPHAIVNPITGIHCVSPPPGQLGMRGNQHVAEGLWKMQNINQPLAEHIRQQHTRYNPATEEIEVLDSSLWPENGGTADE